MHENTTGTAGFGEGDRFEDGDRVGGTVGDADGVSVIRSEERLDVRTVRVATERVRLEKYIVTEERTVTVTVRREEVRVVREPVGATGGSDSVVGAASGEPHVMVLREERPVVTTELVPTERVWLEVTQVTDTVDVNETVRVEHVEASMLPLEDSVGDGRVIR